VEIDSDYGIFSLTGVARFDFQTTCSAWLRRLAGCGVYRFNPAPISIKTADRALTGINLRPNLVDPANVFSGQSCPNRYLNTAAFAQPALGTIGNWVEQHHAHLLNIHRPVTDFRFTERQTVQLRADVFNVTNSFVSDAPTANPTSGAVPGLDRGPNLFGVLNTAQPTRKMHRAKYTF
jgi:hypothetical protein